MFPLPIMCYIILVNIRTLIQHKQEYYPPNPKCFFPLLHDILYIIFRYKLTSEATLQLLTECMKDYEQLQ